jgi:protein SCO1/2
MLCTQMLRAMASTFGVLSMDPGQDFEIVAVSIDPREGPEAAARRKIEVIERYGRPEAAGGWHFLTGETAAIDRVAGAAGFRYAWDEDTQQYAHPAGIVVLTPDGRLARYLFGLEYGPRDLRLALIEASEGAVGSAVDAILLYCYHYDPMTGRYGLVVMRLLRVAGVATVLAIGAFIVVMLRRERRTTHAARST